MRDQGNEMKNTLMYSYTEISCSHRILQCFSLLFEHLTNVCLPTITLCKTCLQ